MAKKITETNQATMLNLENPKLKKAMMGDLKMQLQYIGDEFDVQILRILEKYNHRITAYEGLKKKKEKKEQIQAAALDLMVDLIREFINDLKEARQRAKGVSQHTINTINLINNLTEKMKS